MKITTDAQIRAADLPPGKNELRLPVVGHQGLYLQIRPTSKSWLFRTDAGGKAKVMALGKYPEVGLAKARAKAAECRELLVEGRDPRKEREAAKATAKAGALTVSALFKLWLEGYLKTERKDGGAALDVLFSGYVKQHIGDMRAADVRRADIALVLDAARAKGVKRTVAVLLSGLRQMYGFGIERALLEVDPTARMSAAKFGAQSVERDRVLSRNELVMLARQLRLSAPGDLLPGAARLKDETKLCLWLLLATGIRISELLSLHWRDVDMEARAAVVKMEDTRKKQHSQTLYLSDFAAARFGELAAITKRLGRDPGWCWPAMRKPDTPVCAKSVNKQLNDRQRLVKMRGRSKAGAALALPGGKWVPHDLRRTAATLMGDADVPPHVIEKILGHTDENRIRRTYQRQALEDQKKAAWSVLGGLLEGIKVEADRVSDIV
jgi:integrase